MPSRSWSVVVKHVATGALERLDVEAPSVSEAIDLACAELARRYADHVEAPAFQLVSTRRLEA